MSRYIDADALAYIVASNGDVDFINKVTKLMIDTPSIDIVRCGECKYNSICNRGVQHTTRDMSSVTIGYKSVDFCSYGKVSEKPTSSERSSE